MQTAFLPSARNFGVLSLLLLGCSLFAQRSQDWLQSNDRGNRYEGTYTRKVSNPSVNLVSLTGYLESFPFGEGKVLKAQFYSPDVNVYQLKAEELRISHFYWMQSKPDTAGTGWNFLQDWPVDYFLKRLNINHRNLGVLTYLGEPVDRVFAPVFLYHSQPPGETKRYIAQLRLGRPVSQGHYKVYQGENRLSSPPLLLEKISAKSSGTTFPIIIPTTQLQEGWLFVEINLHEQGSLDPFTYSFRFYHKSP